MKPGEVIEQPVDSGEQWMVVKYVSSLGKKGYQMEAVFIPKDSYQDWLAAEKAKISITQ